MKSFFLSVESVHADTRVLSEVVYSIAYTHASTTNIGTNVRYVQRRMDRSIVSFQLLGNDQHWSVRPSVFVAVRPSVRPPNCLWLSSSLLLLFYWPCVEWVEPFCVCDDWVWDLGIHICSIVRTFFLSHTVLNFDFWSCMDWNGMKWLACFKILFPKEDRFQLQFYWETVNENIMYVISE